MLLEEGWGYSTGVGGSCSTHNPRSVDPHPRGVFRPGAGGLAPSSSQRREAVRAYLAAEDEPLEILGRYRFSLGEREIDLTEAIEGEASAYPL